MSLVVKHSTQAVGTYNHDGELGASQWNEEHTIEGLDDLHVDNVTLTGVTAQALHRSPNAITAMYVYDTSKDSDGGAWTDKCQHTSWYNEPLSGEWLGAQDSELNARYEGALVGSELISNGSFENGSTSWIIDGGWSISANKSTFTGGVNGTLKQNISLIEGRTYQVEFDFDGSGSGSQFFVYLGTVTQIAYIYNPAPGRKKIIGTAGAGGVFQIYDNSAYPNIHNFDNISVKEVLSTTTQSNDYFQLTTDGKFYRLWRNILNYSQDFDNAVWYKTQTSITPNAATAPDGTLTADLLIPNTSNAQHSLGRANSPLTLINGATYTYSIYVKVGGYSTLTISHTSISVGFPAVDLVAGTITGGSGINTITSVGNGWYRISCTGTATSTSGYPIIYPRDTLSIGGDGTSGIYIWGAQVEYGSTATTYEPKGAEGSISEVFRGNKKEFPKLAAIVAEYISAGQGNTSIYDLTEPGNPMWMRFNHIGTGSGDSFIFRTKVVDISAYNSNVYLVENDGTNANCSLDIANFNKDTLTTYSPDISRRRLTNAMISSRNDSYCMKFIIANTPAILGRPSAVDIKVIPGSPTDIISGLPIPTVALATGSGVSIIKSTGDVLNLNSTTAQSVYIKFTDTNDILATRGADSKILVWRYPHWSSGNTWLYQSQYSAAYSSSTQKIANGSGPVYLGSTAGTAHVFKDEATNLGTASGDVELKKITRAAISNIYNTGYQQGDIRRTYLSDNVVESIGPSVELLLNSTFSEGTTHWTVASFLSITNNLDGTITLTGTGPTTAFNVGIYQAVSVEANTVYRLEDKVLGTGFTRAVYQEASSNSNVSLGYLNSSGYYVSLQAHTAYIHYYVWGQVLANQTFDLVSLQKVTPDRSYKAKGATIYGTLTKSPVA